MFALCFGIGAGFACAPKFSSAVFDVCLYFVFVFMFTSTTLLSRSCSFSSPIEIHILHHNNTTHGERSIAKEMCVECHMQWLKWHCHCRIQSGTGKTKLFCIYCASAGTVVDCHRCRWLPGVVATSFNWKALHCRWINSQHKLSSFTLSQLQMLMFIITCSFVYVPHSIPFSGPPNERTKIFRIECQRKRRNTILPSNPYFFWRKENTLHLLEYYY